jgi:hypothetical protein
MPSMADPYLKILWAKEHLGALQEKLRSFCTPTNAYTLTREDDIENECVEGVPDEAFCEIKAFQPYHQGDAFKSHPLWRLDEMCNLDKHRRIPAHGTAVEGVISGLTQEDYATGKVIMETTDECHMISMPISMKDKAQFNPTAPVEVTFGGDQSGIVETLHTIVEIYNFVAVDVLPRFDRFFM